MTARHTAILYQYNILHISFILLGNNNIFSHLFSHLFILLFIFERSYTPWARPLDLSQQYATLPTHI